MGTFQFWKDFEARLVVTASGLTLWGVGAAFWGVVAGALVLGVQRLGR